MHRELTASLTADVATETRGNASVALSMLVALQMAVRAAAVGQHPVQQEGVAELAGAITYEPAQTLDSTGAIAVQVGEMLGQPHFFLEDLLGLFARVQTNEFVSPAGSAVFRCLSMLNHSCLPNATVDFDAEGHAILRTAADIPAGQQLLIDYTAGLGPTLPFARRQQLLAQRHFDCYCARCVRRQ
jgi:SET and MYND domain-containing protein